jgi:hypothetical protein
LVNKEVIAMSRRTDRVRYQFRATENGDGTPWITIDTLGADIPILKDIVTQGFELKPSTTLQEAKSIAEYLNEKLDFFACTVEV